ncbi:MAG: dihydroneopterin aldolase [Gemmatimonadales bacterium]|nr:dihydroneopterin aldolase [Gemmatimonadales bacterium]
MAFTIAVQGLRLPVSIGWTDAERATPQTIRFDVSIELPAVPPAVRSDALADTVDYGAVCDRIEQLVSERPFKLIERLAGAVDEALDDLLPGGSSLTITVTKERPPIRAVEGGASVTLRRTIVR